jgi:hypothetical protein
MYLCLIMHSHLIYYFNIQDVHLLELEWCNTIDWSLKHTFAFYISLLFIFFFMCSLIVEQEAYLDHRKFLIAYNDHRHIFEPECDSKKIEYSWRRLCLRRRCTLPTPWWTPQSSHYGIIASTWNRCLKESHQVGWDGIINNSAMLIAS